MKQFYTMIEIVQSLTCLEWEIHSGWGDAHARPHSTMPATKTSSAHWKSSFPLLLWTLFFCVACFFHFYRLYCHMDCFLFSSEQFIFFVFSNCSGIVRLQVDLIIRFESGQFCTASLDKMPWFLFILWSICATG